MKLLAAVLLLVPADASWNGRIVDLTRLELLKTIGPFKVGTLSPAGQAFAVYNGNSAQLMDVRGERRPVALDGHDQPIHDSGWSRDGRTFATTGYDGQVRVWDAAGGRTLTSLSPHAGYACSVAVSPEGRWVASGGSADAFVKIHESAGGREVRSISTPGGATYALAFSGDARYLAGVQADGNLRAWRTADGAEVYSVSPKAGYVHTSAFSRDGRWLAHPGAGGTLAVVETSGWSEPRVDPTAARSTRSFEGHPGGAGYLAFHPAGRHLASSGVDGSVRIWELATGRRLATLEPRAGASPRLAFTTDGQNLVVVGADEFVRLYGPKP